MYCTAKHPPPSSPLLCRRITRAKDGLNCARNTRRRAFILSTELYESADTQEPGFYNLRYVPSVARRSRLPAARVYLHRRTEKFISEGARERGREGETKRVTKAAPIALSAPFLEDLLRFCRNPIAPSAIKPEPCPVKGWAGRAKGKSGESVTIGEGRRR